MEKSLFKHEAEREQCLEHCGEKEKGGRTQQDQRSGLWSHERCVGTWL